MMTIKPMTTAEELLQIHRLNYTTFVEEIPQHHVNDERVLVDRFQESSRYILAKRNEEVIGMVCYNLQRPFSLDEKMEDLDKYLPQHNRLAEVRLLAVYQNERKTTITYNLLKYLCKTLIDIGVDAAVICGITSQLRLYSHIGFCPFGSLVGTEGALYQPMFITLNALHNEFKIY